MDGRVEDIGYGGKSSFWLRIIQENGFRTSYAPMLREMVEAGRILGISRNR
jgi:hypothetical protein